MPNYRATGSFIASDRRAGLARSLRRMAEGNVTLEEATLATLGLETVEVWSHVVSL